MADVDLSLHKSFFPNEKTRLVILEKRLRDRLEERKAEEKKSAKKRKSSKSKKILKNNPRHSGEFPEVAPEPSAVASLPTRREGEDSDADADETEVPVKFSKKARFAKGVKSGSETGLKSGNGNGGGTVRRSSRSSKGKNSRYTLK